MTTIKYIVLFYYNFKKFNWQIHLSFIIFLKTVSHMGKIYIHNLKQNLK